MEDLGLEAGACFDEERRGKSNYFSLVPGTTLRHNYLNPAAVISY